MTLTFLDFFIIIVALSGIAVLQYFRGRRVNLHLVKYTSRVFEEIIKPKDKTYHIIGMYVGYHAVYWIREGALSRLEATVILMPRYSAFYYPISKLTLRHDRVYLRYWFTRYPGGEAHAIASRAYLRPLSSVINGLKDMNTEILEVNGRRYTIVYRDKISRDKVIYMLKRLTTHTDVKHLAIVPSNKTIYIYAKLDPTSFPRLVRESLLIARKFA